MKEYLLPEKITDSANVINKESLFKRRALHAIYESDVNKWSELAKLDGFGSFITLDFGKEMNGGVRLLTGWIYKGDCKIRVRFGESLGEVNSSIGEKNSTNNHSPRDFETSISASGDLTLGQTGFRFVRIDLLEDKYVIFYNVYCENHVLSKKPVYVYKGNDERIAEIFGVAKRTVDLCAADGYIVDGIKRDRLVWAGDLATETLALSAVYGRLPEIERSLSFMRKTSPLPSFMNGISTYSMWWIIALAYYYEECGRADFIKRQLKYTTGLTELADGLIDENGNVHENVRAFVDWPSKGSPDERVGVRLIFLMAMNKAIELFRVFGVDSTKALGIRNRLLSQPFSVQEKKQIIALKYFATGEITDTEYEKITEGGAHGFSTFMSYFILETIASRDEELAVELMKEYYGGMLDRGATTFWEDFDLKWLDGSGRIDAFEPGKKEIHGDFGENCYKGYRCSLCHGWSAGVLKFIKNHCSDR